MDTPGNSPITDAVYGKKAARKKPAKPSRKPRLGTTLGELLDPSAAASLVALRAELEAAQPKKRKPRPRKPKQSAMITTPRPSDDTPF